MPQLTLWELEAYKDTINSYTLYEGIVLGIAGLLAVFLTILFVVKGSAMFPGHRGAGMGGHGLYLRGFWLHRQNCSAGSR